MSVSTGEEKKCRQKQPPEVFYNKGALRPQTCNFIKKRLWHRCCPLNFAKCLRTTFSQNTSGRLLLCRVIQVMEDEGLSTNCIILLFCINISLFLTFLTLLVALNEEFILF